MAITIIATAGASDANSYLTVAEADTLAEERLGTLTWTTAADEDKKKALVQATRYMDTLEYIGERASTTQSLLWPRTDAKCGDKDYASTVIPPEIQEATFDLAEGLLNNPGLISGQGVTASTATTGELVAGVPNADLKRLKLDVMELEWKNATNSSRYAATPLSVMPHLLSTLGCLTKSVIPGANSQIPLVRN